MSDERREQTGVTRDDNDGRVLEVKVDRHILDPNDPLAVQVPKEAEPAANTLEALASDTDPLVDRTEEDAERGRKYQSNTLNPNRVPGLGPKDENPDEKSSSRKSPAKSDDES